MYLPDGKVIPAYSTWHPTDGSIQPTESPAQIAFRKLALSVCRVGVPSREEPIIPPALVLSATDPSATPSFAFGSGPRSPHPSQTSSVCGAWPPGFRHTVHFDRLGRSRPIIPPEESKRFASARLRPVEKLRRRLHDRFLGG